MTDADTLALAYFRAEFHIQPYQARILHALWSARRPLTAQEWGSRAGVTDTVLKVGVCGLRETLDQHAIIGAIDPAPEVSRAGAARLVFFSLAPHARTEINRMIASATQGLLAQLPPAEPFNDIATINGPRRYA